MPEIKKYLKKQVRKIKEEDPFFLNLTCKN